MKFGIETTVSKYVASVLPEAIYDRPTDLILWSGAHPLPICNAVRIPRYSYTIHTLKLIAIQDLGTGSVINFATPTFFLILICIR